jgi:hypothetical protein
MPQQSDERLPKTGCFDALLHMRVQTVSEGQKFNLQSMVNLWGAR